MKKEIKFEIGKKYKTRGGWTAQCVWLHKGHNKLNEEGRPIVCWCIHEGCDERDVMVQHDNIGHCCESTLRVGYFAPTNLKRVDHPADIVEVYR